MGDSQFREYSLERTLTGHDGSVASVKFSPDGQWCVGLCVLLCRVR
jgi:WD40 repeat protein